MISRIIRITNAILIVSILSSQFAYSRIRFRARPNPRTTPNQNYNYNSYNKKYSDFHQNNHWKNSGSRYYNPYGEKRGWSKYNQNHFNQEYWDSLLKKHEALNKVLKDTDSWNFKKLNEGEVNSKNISEAGIIDIRNCEKNEAIRKIENSAAGDLIVLDRNSLSHAGIKESLKSGNSHLCVRSDNVDQKILSTLGQETSGSPQIIAILPDTLEGISRTYYIPKSKVSRQALDQMRTASNSWKSLDGCTVFSGKNGNQTIASAIKADLKKANPNEIVIVFGHSENGRLICPDGSYLQIKDVHWLTKESFGAVLSCETVNSTQWQGLLTTKRLHFDDTAKALEKVKSEFTQRIANGEKIRNADFLIALNKNLSLQKQKKGKSIKIGVGTIGGGSVLGVIVEMLLDEEDDDENDSDGEDTEKLKG